MNLLIKTDQVLENAESVGLALIQLIEENLNISKWDFHLTFKKLDKVSSIKLIYDSEWCRVKFTFSRQRTPQQDELSIDYGRLHAPNEEPFMDWQGEKCRCWHSIVDTIRFLDRLSPFEAMQQTKVHRKAPLAIEEFKQSETGRKLLAEYPPKFSIMLHSMLWQQYQKRLFETFDLRNPIEWENYSKFIKEYYGLMGTKSSLGPPYGNIC